MRVPLLLLILACMVGGAACETFAPKGLPSCDGDAAPGTVGTGTVTYEIIGRLNERGTLPYCFVLSIFDPPATTGRLVFTNTRGAQLIGGKRVELSYGWATGDTLVDLFLYRSEPNGTFNPNLVSFATISGCDFRFTRNDAFGSEGTFLCVEEGTTATGTFVVNLSAPTPTSLPTATQPGPTQPGPTQPEPTQPEPSFSAAPVSDHCGPDDSVDKGMVQFDITGEYAGESGARPYCAVFSVIHGDGDTTFLVFTDDMNASELDGVSLELRPEFNVFQYHGNVSLTAVDCDVTLSRDDASGIAGTFSCTATTPAGHQVSGTFEVNR